MVASDIYKKSGHVLLSSLIIFYIGDAFCTFEHDIYVFQDSLMYKNVRKQSKWNLASPKPS